MRSVALLILALSGCAVSGIDPAPREGLDQGGEANAAALTSFNNLEGAYHRDTQSLQNQLRRALLKNELLKVGVDGLTSEEADAALKKDADLAERYATANAKTRSDAARAREHYVLVDKRISEAAGVLSSIERRRTANDQLRDNVKKTSGTVVGAAIKGATP